MPPAVLSLAPSRSRCPLLQGCGTWHAGAHHESMRRPEREWTFYLLLKAGLPGRRQWLPFCDCRPPCLGLPACAGALRALRSHLRSPSFASLDDAAYGASVSESSSSGAEGRATQFVRRSRGLSWPAECGAGAWSAGLCRHGLRVCWADRVLGRSSRGCETDVVPHATACVRQRHHLPCLACLGSPPPQAPVCLCTPKSHKAFLPAVLTPPQAAACLWRWWSRMSAPAARGSPSGAAPARQT